MFDRPPGCGTRITLSGWVGSSMVSPMRTVQVAPSSPVLVSFGRSSLSCTTCPSSERVTLALRMPRPDCATICEMSIGVAASKTSQIVSERRNIAAAVGCANGNAMRSASP